MVYYQGSLWDFPQSVTNSNFPLQRTKGPCWEITLMHFICLWVPSICRMATDYSCGKARGHLNVKTTCWWWCGLMATHWLKLCLPFKQQVSCLPAHVIVGASVFGWKLYLACCTTSPEMNDALWCSISQTLSNCCSNKIRSCYRGDTDSCQHSGHCCELNKY